MAGVEEKEKGAGTGAVAVAEAGAEVAATPTPEECKMAVSVCHVYPLRRVKRVYFVRHGQVSEGHACTLSPVCVCACAGAANERPACACRVPGVVP